MIALSLNDGILASKLRDEGIETMSFLEVDNSFVGTFSRPLGFLREGK